MTFQEAFDKVLTAMRQRAYKRAVDSAGQCVMCMEDGTQCAIGILTDAKADEAVRTVLRRSEELFPNESKSGASVFLDRLQHVHDTTATPALFETGMRRIAHLHDLVYLAP